MGEWIPRLAALWFAACTVKMVYALASGRVYVYSRWDGGAFGEGRVLSGNALVAIFVATSAFSSAVLASVLHWLPEVVDRPIVYATGAVAIVLSLVLPRWPDDDVRPGQST